MLVRNSRSIAAAAASLRGRFLSVSSVNNSSSASAAPGRADINPLSMQILYTVRAENLSTTKRILLYLTQISGSRSAGKRWSLINDVEDWTTVNCRVHHDDKKQKSVKIIRNSCRHLWSAVLRNEQKPKHA